MQLTFAIEEADIPDALKIIMFRVLEEALANVGRHSRADRVQIALQKVAGNLELAVQDNGTGFRVDDVIAVGHLGKAMGLGGVKKRIQLVGGALDIRSAPGSGTLVRVIVPLAEAKRA
jgi:signal transduction histidine kinase